MPLFYQKTVTYVSPLPVTYLTSLYTVLVRSAMGGQFAAGKSGAAAKCGNAAFYGTPSDRLLPHPIVCCANRTSTARPYGENAAFLSLPGRFAHWPWPLLRVAASPVPCGLVRTGRRGRRPLRRDKVPNLSLRGQCAHWPWQSASPVP